MALQLLWVEPKFIYQVQIEIIIHMQWIIIFLTELQITNTTSALGSELKRQLELLGLTVIEGATNGAEADKVDALVVVGAETQASGLNGMADLVSRDIYDNMKV